MCKQGSAAIMLWWGLLFVFTPAHLPAFGDVLAVLCLIVSMQNELSVFDNVVLFAYSLRVFWNGGRPLYFMWCVGSLNWKGQNL